MLLSSYLLYHYDQMRKIREGANGQLTPGQTTIGLTVILLILAVELVLAVWAIVMAVRCGKKHGYTIVHVVLAFFFPLFYLIYGYVDGCGL